MSKLTLKEIETALLVGSVNLANYLAPAFSAGDHAAIASKTVMLTVTGEDGEPLGTTIIPAMGLAKLYKDGLHAFQVAHAAFGTGLDNEDGSPKTLSLRDLLSHLGHNAGQEQRAGVALGGRFDPSEDFDPEDDALGG